MLFYSELSFHIVLERECREIIMLLTEPEKTSKAIQEYFDGIKHDLNYIYRLRNQLIHSTKDIDDSLEYYSAFDCIAMLTLYFPRYYTIRKKTIYIALQIY